jgi:hypothetical protein
MGKIYEVSYKMRNPRYPNQITFLIGWATEKLKARGIVHASKLAKDHLRELAKIAPEELQIEWIREFDKCAPTTA